MTRSPKRPATVLLIALIALGSAAPGAVPVAGATSEFPAGDTRYHTYAEMSAEVAAVAAAHPTIVRRFSIGRSYQGREIWAAKVSDNVGVDESEPEVVFDGLHHAQEHMSAEMTLAILHWLVDGYGSDTQVTRLVKSREIWIVFMVNPDGGEYDIAGRYYHGWRKNRQLNTGSSSVGTDLNRNYDYHWGCCGGSSSDPANSKYRGIAPFSAPESRAFADFIRSRVVNGRQQIRAGISFHTDGRLVMWPYGYTYNDLPSDMTTTDQAVLSALGRRMAASNGYKPIQASDLYITDGGSRDWAYGRYRIFAFTFEMTIGAYAADDTIASETGRNRDAVLQLLEYADCPYRVTGTQATNCGPLFDDLEINRGWTLDPSGTDTATAGRWQIADPAATTYRGAKQLGTTTSGRYDLVTGAAAGISAGTNDLDGGRTTIRSAPVALPSGVISTLRFRYAFAHDAHSSADDYLRITVSGPTRSSIVFRVSGAAVDRDATWLSASVPLSSFAGQIVRLRIEAGDLARGGLVEAAVDDIRITRP